MTQGGNSNANPLATESRVTEGGNPPTVFVSGRQYSGNTLLTMVIGRMNGCFALTNESNFFDRRQQLGEITAPRQMAEELVASLKLPEASDREATVEHLADWLSTNPEATPLDACRESVNFLLADKDCRFIAQKATHYVFFGDELLGDMPEARLIYMIRNPYDIVASRKRRSDGIEHIFGTVISWNRGVRIATRLAKDHPGRVLLVHYEELVQEPEATLQKISDLLGEPFDPDVLNVPHVNPSEDKYKVVQGSKGINKSRLFYYVNHLRGSEIAAIDQLADRRLIEEHYPTLPHRESPTSISARAIGVGRVAVGPLLYGIDRFIWARKRGFSPLAYFRQRLFRRR